MPSDFDQVILGGIRGWFEEQLKSKNILNQNGANLVYNHGRNTAKSLGLPYDQIMPYPPRTEINVQVPEPEKEPEKTSLMSKMAYPLVVGTSMLLGAGGTYLATAMATRPAPDESTIVQPIDPQIGFTVE